MDAGGVALELRNKSNKANHDDHRKLQEKKLENAGLMVKERHPGNGQPLKALPKKGGKGTGNWGGVDEQIDMGIEDVYTDVHHSDGQEAKIVLD